MAPFLFRDDIFDDGGEIFLHYYDTGADTMPHKLTLSRRIKGTTDGYTLINTLSENLITLFNWCEEQFGPPYRNPIWRMTREPITFHFERKDDAMLFKLNSQL